MDADLDYIHREEVIQGNGFFMDANISLYAQICYRQDFGRMARQAGDKRG